MSKILFVIGFCFLSSGYALLPATPALDSNLQSVVLLKIPGPDVDGDIVDGLCNGTLLSADTLVTAAHCVAGSILGQGAAMKLEIGAYLIRQRPDGSTYRTGYVNTLLHQSAVAVQFVNGVSFGSAPNRIPPENDFAVVKLKNALNLPPDFVFAKVWNRSIQGLSLLNPTVVSVNPLEYISSLDTKQIAELNRITFAKYSAQSQSVSRVAQGDSGAPLFAKINGFNYLVGVTKGRAETGFSNWDVFAIWAERLVF
jgi:hypothetical protein